MLADKYTNLSGIRPAGEHLVSCPGWSWGKGLQFRGLDARTHEPRGHCVAAIHIGLHRRSKGSHGQSLQHIAQFGGGKSLLGLNPSSRGVSWLPPYHDMGLISGMLAPIYAAPE